MKEVLEKMAHYNAKAGDAMLELLAKAPSDIAAKDVGAYFKSIDGITEHMAWAVVLWLKRFAGFGTYACLATSALVAKPLDEIGSETKGNREKTASLFREANELLSRFVSELPSGDFGRRVRYRTTDGNELERTLWHTVFQVLNHGTHHRGEISAILDMNGVANDFNSFVTYMP